MKTMLGFPLLVLLQLTNLASSIAQEFPPHAFTNPTDPRRRIERRLPDGMGDKHHMPSAGSHLRNEASIFTHTSTDDSLQPAWVRRYTSGLIPSIDKATAVAIDDSGNVYMTRSSNGLGTNDDYTTIIYSTSGAGRGQLW